MSHNTRNPYVRRRRQAKRRAKHDYPNLSKSGRFADMRARLTAELRREVDSTTSELLYVQLGESK